MSIKIKKAKFIVPFLFLALSQFAFAGGFEQEQMKSVEQTFFDCTHQVQMHTSVSVQTTQFERFRLKIREAALALEGQTTFEARQMAAALRSLEAKIEMGGQEIRQDWGKFSLTVSVELGVVSEHMRQFGIRFEEKLLLVGTTIEADTVAFACAVKKAAHQAAETVEQDIAATEKRMAEWGNWLHAKLVAAKNTTVADWHLFAKEVALEAHKFGGECEKFGSKIRGAIETGELDSKLFFYSLAAHLEDVGCKTYHGIGAGFATLEEDVQQDWEKTLHFFVRHFENQAIACGTQQQMLQQIPVQQQFPMQRQSPAQQQVPLQTPMQQQNSTHPSQN